MPIRFIPLLEKHLKSLQEEDVTKGAIEEEEGGGEGGGRDNTKSPDIVGVYADRLSAVTHAFSLCSKAMMKANGNK